MNYIVYEVKNKVNGKTYIGKHQTDNIYDDYLGSGKYLKRAINKYGKDCFEKIILHVFDNKKEMDDKEEELANDEYVKNKSTYNLKKGGDGGWDYLNDGSENHIIRCRKAGKKGYESTLKNVGKEKLFYDGLCKSQKSIKKILIKRYGNKCCVCNTEIWNNKPIPIEIEHIDGNSNNNKPDNVILICPNCHAQTDTYKGKNKGNGRYSRKERYQQGKSY